MNDSTDKSFKQPRFISSFKKKINATLYITSMTFMNNFTTTIIESWFIPLDILGIICLTLTIILTIICLSIIALDKTCHTVSMILSANICFTGFILALTHFTLVIFTFSNDLKQIQHQDSLCVIRGYFSYVSPTLQSYSYLSSAIYKYILIVYPTHLSWHSARTQLLSVILGWILAFLFPLPLLLTGQIIYDVDNQICELPFRLSFAVIYTPHFVFIIPVSLVMFIYFKLVQYVKEIGKNLSSVATLVRAQRDLTMVRRIVILSHIILTTGVQMTLFLILSFFNLAPKYHSLIGYIFLYTSVLCSMIVLFQFTDPLKVATKKIIFGRRSTVLPATMGKFIWLEKKNVETMKH